MTDAGGTEIGDAAKARALARALLADIALYNREDLRAGRDMTSVFDEARALYAGRVVHSLHGIFDEEVAAFVARDDARPDPPSEDRVRRNTRIKVATTVLTIALLIIGMLWSTRTEGEEVATAAIPGSSTFNASRGDTLRFEVDHAVLFHAGSLEDAPAGCFLDMTLSKNGRVLASSRCDLFHTADGTDIENGTNAEEAENGLTRLEVFELRLSCGFHVPDTGRITITTTSNLGSCVSRSERSTLHIYRDDD